LFIFFCLGLIHIITASANLNSYLKIDIIEAINLHCKLNNEFYCNPYTIIEFKYSSESKTSKQIECTKNPAWNSQFIFEPEYCKDIIYIYFYQYLTPKDNAFLGDAVVDENLYERGNIKPGYLGRIIIELEKLTFGAIEDWFMIESPVDNSRIIFPSCVYLRINWTSGKCHEPGMTGAYQINSILNNFPITEKIKFEPKNFIAVCKADFAKIYKTKFSALDSEGPIKKINENLSEIELLKEKCTKDPNQDYGFDHPSNLTSIEEALGYKIIKRITGEDLDYSEFTKNFQKYESSHFKTFRQFFEKECFENPELTIERINNILLIDAQDLKNLNTTNPYLTIDKNLVDLPIKLANQRDENIYSTTLKQFNSIEDVKNLDKMDDESYIKSLNKIVNVIREMEVENKTDYTIFYNKNKVIMTNQGLVNPIEEKFFRIFSLYKWNGGHVEYDELKKEYLLRRKNFYCYELVKIMPTNIIFQFVEDHCPDNYVCVDPNGIVIDSLGKDPRNVFGHELNKNGIDFYANLHNNGLKDEVKNLENFSFKQVGNANKNKIKQDEKRIKMRFTENKKNANNIENKEIINNIENKDNKVDKVNPEQDVNNDIINFQTILKMESGNVVSSKSLPDISNDSEKLWLNKFDRLYYERRKRIKLKKEIIINKVYSHIPILGEILALANFQIKNPHGIEINEEFILRETNLFKKYLLIYNANLPFVDKAAKLLLNLVLCNTDKNRLKYILNEMLEGLCLGDDRSIKIFEEIIRSIIIDSLINTNYFKFDELHAKSNLLRTFNKPFCFKLMTKVKFLENMIMLEVIREKITYIIWNIDTNKKIFVKILETENSIPLQLPENKRLFSYDKILGFDNARDINKNFLSELKSIQNTNSYNNNNKAIDEFKFKSINLQNNENFEENNNNNYNNSNKQLKSNLKFSLKNLIEGKQNNKYNLSTNNKENEYFENLFNNITDLENINTDFDFESMDNHDSFLSKNEKEIEAPLKPNMNESSLLITISKNLEDLKKILKQKKYQINANMNNTLNNSISNTDKQNFSRAFEEMKFKELNKASLSEKLKTEKDQFNQFNNELLKEDSENDFSNLSLQEYNNPHIYETHDAPGINIVNTDKQPSEKDILDKVMEDPETRKILADINKDPKNKVLLPREIHSTYEVNKRGVKQITINNNSNYSVLNIKN